jgi:pimeloyl-ACP methyl ester carboxylesterase
VSLSLSTRRAALAVSSVGGAVATGVGAASLTGALYFARRVLTPDPRRPDDCVIERAGEQTLTLGLNLETVVPGRYGLWLDGGSGHARVGDIVRIDDEAGLVERELLGVDYGRLRLGPVRWNQYYYASAPDISLGLPTEHVMVETDVGAAPAWVVPAESETGRWAVLVHGRGARREECLRGVAPLRDAGLTVMIPSYRNDEVAPPGPDGRYNLGLSEWKDIEQAILYAVGRGADEVVLGGWSMGGAIVLQLLDRSWTSSFVSKVVLDGPVINWNDVLEHHARLNHVPAPVGSLGRTMMGRRWGRRLVGVHEAVDVAKTDWVRRADELHHPMLIIHSDDDEFVPVGPSRALAEARPDLVTFEPWFFARHCKEWNTDPDRWERLVRKFVSS